MKTSAIPTSDKWRWNNAIDGIDVFDGPGMKILISWRSKNLVVIDMMTSFGMIRVVRMLLLGFAGIGVADGGLLLLTLASRLLVDLFNGAQFFLEFHASVLEPDFDLALGQTEGVRDFNPPPPRQVVIEVELFFQFQRLVARVSLSASSSWTSIGSLTIRK